MTNTTKQQPLRKYPTIGTCGLDCGVFVQDITHGEAQNAPVAVVQICGKNIQVALFLLAV